MMGSCEYSVAVYDLKKNPINGNFMDKKIIVEKSLWENIQGTESSDFSLISDFFPTLRTILEISVNLERIFF